MSKFELILEHRTRSEIDQIVDAIAQSSIGCWWRFEQYENRVITRDSHDLGNIYYNMGLTMGGKGRIFIEAHTDSDIITLRLLLGL